MNKPGRLTLRRWFPQRDFQSPHLSESCPARCTRNHSRLNYLMLAKGSKAGAERDCARPLFRFPLFRFCEEQPIRLGLGYAGLIRRDFRSPSGPDQGKAFRTSVHYCVPPTTEQLTPISTILRVVRPGRFGAGRGPHRRASARDRRLLRGPSGSGPGVPYGHRRGCVAVSPSRVCLRSCRS